jgi:ferric-dicitrate binding protein FerR (iron transport regulator)
MQTSDPRLQELFERWFNNQLLPAEQEELLLLLDDAGVDAAVSPLLKKAWEGLLATPAYTVLEKDRMVNSILQQSPAQQAKSVPLFSSQRVRWWAVAAVLLVIIATGTWRWLQPYKAPVVATTQVYDVAPGKDGAILTLADGTTVVLDSLGNGVVATQKGARLLLHNGQLAYAAGDPVNGAPVYNKMTTPRGRQFQLILPDGTKVWLNAASSIKYPTAFLAGERRVELEGEAYFEVAKNAEKPFFVKINDKTEVEVLGTHFNVNAYPDEDIMHTTLLEGAVRVNCAFGIGFLKPGDQASVVRAGYVHPAGSTKWNLRVTAVNTQQFVAWKEGVFDFGYVNNLQAVMRQLARWYDVEIVYEKNVPNLEIWGKMQRNLTLVQVLKVLKGMDLNFRLEEGRRLVILP